MSKRKEKRAHRRAAVKQAGGGLHGRAVQVTSRMRFSLTFRIALHYCMQLMRTVLLEALLLTLGMCAGLFLILNDDIDRIRAAEIPEGVTYVAYAQDVIQNDAIRAAYFSSPLSEDTSVRVGMFFRSNLESLPQQLTLRLGALEAPGQIRIYVDMLEAYRLWLLLMSAALVCDVLRIVYFMRHNDRLKRRVLAPIQDITELAATLSASNLSNRINIAGTKNELKDLATVINTMLDRIERSYNSQKQFVSDASHELRTPIAVMQGYVNMLQRWGKEDKTVLDEGLTAIAQETANMKDLVENLLFLARHDKKTLMLEMEEFDPCDVALELHKEAEMVTPGDHFMLNPLEHCTIQADRNMVKQVMRILLDNAVKYTPQGGTITMGVARTEGGCVLTMQDNGPGIAGEELPKIFDRFYRSDSARKSEGGGHGLGLSIARIIVVAHGGRIRVRSKLGEGTTFAVMLPAVQGKPLEAEKTADGGKNRKKIRKRKRAKAA